MLSQLARWFAMLTMGASACLLLPACSPVVPTSQSILLPAVSPTTPVTITFWHTQTGSSTALLSTLANDFHKAYPTIIVRGEQKASEGDLLKQGLAAIAMNQVPDLVIGSNRTIAEFARKGALVNLDPWMSDVTIGLRDEDRSDFLPGFLDLGRIPEVKNQPFSLPFDKDAVVLYYNADLLKAAKAEVPPRTWDQFSHAARSTTKGSVRGWAMLPNAAIFYAFLFSRGGSVLNQSQNQAQFDDDAGMKSLQLIVALSQGGAAYLADSADSVCIDFAEGKTALFFGTIHDQILISDAIARANSKFEWGLTKVPQNNPNHPLTAVLGSDIALFRPVLSGASGMTADRERAAWLFVRWLLAPEQTARWARTTYSIPVRASAQSLLAVNSPPPLQRLRDGFGDKLPSGSPLPSVKDAGLIDVAITEMWLSVANGADPVAALRNATTRVNRLLDQAP